jgi:hypothetical protein
MKVYVVKSFRDGDLRYIDLYRTKELAEENCPVDRHDYEMVEWTYHIVEMEVQS